MGCTTKPKIQTTMKRIVCYLTFAALIAALPASAAGKPANPAAHSVKLRFVPVPHDPSSGKGADWTALTTWDFLKQSGLVMVMAHAGAGDTFPIKEELKPKVFDVSVVAGNDAHLVLEIRSEEGSQKFNVKRGKAVTTQVKGRKYSLAYASSTVASDEKNQRTDKASIFIFRLP
jgi:hypothetical protein